MVLRLDPDIPVVWRGPAGVQFGVERVLGIVDPLTAAQERVLSALRSGIGEHAYEAVAGALGASPQEAEELFEAASPAMTRSIADGLRADAAPRVTVRGSDGLARDIAATLAGTVELRDDEDVDFAVLVAPWVVSPADSGTWLRRDIPHLAVTLGDGVVTVGPLVVPGRTACLYCLHAHRRDADRAWPAIAAQLLDRSPPPIAAVIRHEATALVARRVAGHLMRAATGEAGGDGAWASRLSPDSDEVRTLAWAPHAECRCGARPESDWAGGAGRASPARPTTATDAAGRA